MPYDPRMLQLAQRGIGMMGPGASPFDRANQPRQWWDQPPPSPQRRPDDSNAPQPAMQPPNPSKPWWEQAVQIGQPANQAVNMPDDRSDKERKQQPSLLQMLMLGGQPSYSGTPRPGPQQGNPWGWLGGLGWGGKP